jgi:UDP-glucose 4-epimerase
MKCLVTGVAGFLGSHLAEALLKDSHEIIGVDCFTDYYSKDLKKRNLVNLKQNRDFTFLETDLVNLDLGEILKNLDWVFHLAAQAGVRTSWGKTFKVYTKNNILITQKLLEAAKNSNLKGFIYGSSSSVYGNVKSLPLSENTYLKPISPYGVTKLAAEGLCYLYYKNFGIPVVVLRYFTVYGPRQRPDMAFHRFLRATLSGEKIEIFGNGEQSRDFTYVSDVTEAHLRVMKQFYPGEVFNIGNGSQTTIKTALSLIAEITGKQVNIVYKEEQKGDVYHTIANISKAQKLLGYKPIVKMAQGLENEWQWIQTIYKNKEIQHGYKRRIT